jgi:hypothetical protein
LDPPLPQTIRTPNNASHARVSLRFIFSSFHAFVSHQLRFLSTGKDSGHLSNISVDLLAGAPRNEASFCSYEHIIQLQIINRKKLYEAKILIVDAPLTPQHQKLDTKCASQLFFYEAPHAHLSKKY